MKFNEAAQREFEQKLRTKIRKTRIIWLIVTLALGLASLIFAIARENTKLVTQGLSGIRFTDYSVWLTLALIIAFCLFMTAFAFFVGSLIYGKLDTVEVSDDYVTLYRGLGGVALYVNGELADRSRYYLEAWLSDCTKVTVSLSRNYLWAHMSFSNGRADVDL